jgi:hypothetical protein
MIHDVTATWWWIAYRIVAVAIVIIRHRNDEEMKMRFRILMFGLIVEGSALCTFLAIPIFRRVFKKIPWHEKLVVLAPRCSIAMLIFWAMVLIVGLGEKLTYILYPCTDSESSVCSILISVSLRIVSRENTGGPECTLSRPFTSRRLETNTDNIHSYQIVYD